MTFVPAPAVIAFDAIWTLDNQNVENTFNYHFGGTINYALLQAMATTYFNWVTSKISAWPTNCECNKVYVRDLTTQFSVVGEFQPPTPLVGTATGTVLPNSCSIAIKRETQKSGRANRGRVYWLAIREADRADDNHLLPTRANQFRDDLNTLLASQLSDNSVQEVILHKKLGTFTIVTNYVCTDYTIDNQRRRLPDHNRHH